MLAVVDRLEVALCRLRETPPVALEMLIITETS